MSGLAQVVDFEQARAKRTARKDEPWVDKAAIARHLGCSRRTVSRYMQAGLPFRRRFEHSHPRFQVGAVDEWMEGR